MFSNVLERRGHAQRVDIASIGAAAKLACRGNQYAAVTVLAAILFPAIRASRLASRRMQRSNELKQVGLSLHNFSDVYERFPAATRRDDVGRPLSSWRYRVLPFLAGFMVEVDYDRPWFDPEAKYFSTYPLGCFCFPEADETAPLNANVVSIVGPGTVFDDARAAGPSDFDGQTILAMEIADFDRHWMEPGDLHVADVSTIHLNGIDTQGVHVVLVDGSVRFLPNTTPIEEFKKYMTFDAESDRTADLSHE
jgi:hypothetical protein